jgi:hypothetical protein
LISERPDDLHAGRCRVVKERRSEKELRQIMLEAARQHVECSELEDLFIFGPTPRPGANWGFGIAGKENKVSVACYKRLDQIASRLQGKYELHPVKANRRDIEARVWSLVHDHPTLKAGLSHSGGAYDLATFRKLEGQPNWTMEWNTDDQLAKAAFERIVRSVQTQIELE